MACVVAVLSTAVDAKPPKQSGVTKAPLSLLHPMQGAVGMREVGEKRAEIERIKGDAKKLDRYLARHVVPVIIGPGRIYYMIDRHHMSLALVQARIAEAYVEIVEDHSSLSAADFWRRMEAEGKVHAYDSAGVKIDPAQLPPSLSGLRNDPYRDLAGTVRNAGGFLKTPTPYSEFSWADFFRSRVDANLIASDYNAAVQRGMALAQTRDAAALPGFIGVR